MCVCVVDRAILLKRTILCDVVCDVCGCICSIWVRGYFLFFKSNFSFFCKFYQVIIVVSIWIFVWWRFKVVFVIKVLNIGRWSELSECLVLQVVLLWSVEDTYVMSSGDVYWCVVFGTLCLVLCAYRVVNDVEDHCPSMISSAWVRSHHLWVLDNVCWWCVVCSLLCCVVRRKCISWWYASVDVMCLLEWILTICSFVLWVLMLFPYQYPEIVM